MKNLLSKIKGINCRIEQKDELNNLEVFCYNYSKCESCCGLEACECNNKLAVKEK